MIIPVDKLKRYNGQKINQLNDGIKPEINAEYEKYLSKTDYTNEEWKEIITTLEKLKDESLKLGDYSIDSQTYSNSSNPIHFLYEILQNADDCKATKVKIEITSDHICFSHNGRPFNLKDLFSICGLGLSSNERSNNESENNRIGKFGVGFKTVFPFCDEPVVNCSNGCNFQLKKYVVPVYVEGQYTESNEIETAFFFTINKEHNYEIFIELLSSLNIDWNILLFLNNVCSVSLKNDLVDDPEYSEYCITIKGDSTEYIIKKNGINVSSWVKQIHELNYIKDKFNQSISPKVIFAFRLDGNTIIPLKNPDDNTFYLYMPLESAKNPFNFLIHADFNCDASRKSLSIDDYNEKLFSCIEYKLFLAIESLSNDFPNTFLNILPLKKDEPQFNLFAKSAPEKISEFVRNNIKLEDNFKNIIEDGVPHVVDKATIDFLANDNDLIKSISENLINFELHKLSAKYLVEWGIASDFNVEKLIDNFEKIDLSNRLNDWFIKLFYYLKLKLENNSVPKEEIGKLTIYKDSKGILRSLLNDSNVVQFFFCPDDENVLKSEDFRHFKSDLIFLNVELYREDDLKDFFVELGVNTFGKESIIEYIINVINNLQPDNLNKEEMLFYTTYLFKNKDKINIYDNYPLWSAFDNLHRSGKILLKIKNGGWYASSEIYFSCEYFSKTNPSSYLEDIFSPIGCHFLDPIYIEKLNDGEKNSLDEIKKWFSSLEVEDKPRIIKIQQSVDDVERTKYQDMYKDDISNEMIGIMFDKGWVNEPTYRIQYINDANSVDLDLFMKCNIENKGKLAKKLILLLDGVWKKEWNERTLYGDYWNSKSIARELVLHVEGSSLLSSLSTAEWVPSTENNKLSKPKGVFYSKGLKLILGQPYLNLDETLKNQDFIDTFFKKHDPETLINQIEKLRISNDSFDTKLEKLCNLLEYLSSVDLSDFTKNELKTKEIILIVQAGEKWYPINKVAWDYKPKYINIFGNRGCISDKYKKYRLQKFFTDLGMLQRDNIGIEHYLERLVELQNYKEEGLDGNEFENHRNFIYKIVEQLIVETDALDEIDNSIEKFKNKGCIYCKDGEFHKFTDGLFFVRQYSRVYDLFSKYSPYFKKHVIDANYEEYNKFIDKLELPLLDNSIEKTLNEEVPSKRCVESELFDLDKISKYLLAVVNSSSHNNKSVEDYTNLLKNLSVQYAEEIHVKHLIKGTDVYFTGSCEHFYYNLEGCILIKDNTSKNKKILNISKGLCDLFEINYMAASLFERIIESSDKADEIENYLIAHDIKLLEHLPQSGEIPSETGDGGGVVYKESDETNGDMTKEDIGAKPEDVAVKVPEEIAGNITGVSSKRTMPHQKSSKYVQPGGKSDASTEKVVVDIQDDSKYDGDNFTNYDIFFGEIEFETHEEPDAVPAKRNNPLTKEYNGTKTTEGNSDSDRKIQSSDTMKEIGMSGEQIVVRYLKEKYNNSMEIHWQNENVEAKKPYDILITKNGDEEYIEVKSTVQNVNSIFYFSRKQFEKAKEKGDKYHIYRVFKDDTKIKIIDIVNPYRMMMDGGITIEKFTIKI